MYVKIEIMLVAGLCVASQECVINVEMTYEKLTKAVASNASRESQRNFLQKVVCKADEMC
jgi:hypothetical protein